ncbi:uncharacterized protein BO96DRAFT_349374 [Aspergillus niger CBS 101883]|uniref:Uncharacterized protein n=2 Tax=Aspergillus niger TaxID=5061 RepID=A2RAZ5_ASPNC|nr:uncharacterized protein BO96DRAFT_349374 [Aspergillus niger CBS 101883]XP_059602959.1 hypothetical protein An18g04900 [Aspergillus niger]PYH51745.1 hypothetical protein BO96DRAFT_349374 [Aspergillus niger CBS 101883]CAK43291.1 hypothetical protein An18g04900 [Aspergillus niger]
MPLCWGVLKKFLAVDAARYLELGLRGNIVTVLGDAESLSGYVVVALTLWFIDYILSRGIPRWSVDAAANRHYGDSAVCRCEYIMALARINESSRSPSINNLTTQRAA